MSHTRSFLHATGIVFFSSFLAAGVGYLLKIVLARSLSLEEFGLFSAVFAFVSLFVGFSDMGIGLATVKQVAQFNAEKKFGDIKNSLLYLTLFQLAFLVVVFPILALLAPYLSVHYFKNPAAAQVLLVVLLAFVFSTFEVFYATAFYGFKRMVFLSLTHIIKPGLVVLAILLLLPSVGPVALVPAYAYLISFGLAPIIYHFMFRKTFPTFSQFRMSWNPALAKQLALAGFAILLGGLGSMFLGSIGTLLLTHYRTLSEVAIYGVAFSLMNVMRQIPRSLSVVLLPVSSELYTAKDPEFTPGIKKLYIYSFIVGLPIVLGIIFFAKLVITLLFGANYVDAAAPLQILALGSIPLAILLINESIFKGIGKPNRYAMISGIGAVIGLVLSVVLIPMYGASGAAMGFAGAILVMMVLSLIILRKYLTLELPLFAWLRTILAGIGFISVLYAVKAVLHVPIVVEVIILLGLASAVYGALLLLLRVVSIRELRKILANVL